MPSVMPTRNSLQVRKTITCCLYDLIKRKQLLLDEIYESWHNMTRVKKPYRKNREMYPEILSKYCSQASIAKPNDPVYLDTQDMFGIIETGNKNKYFIWIKVKPRLRIFCPVRGNLSFNGCTIHDSKLFKRDDHYEIHLAISKNVTLDSNPRNILSVDLGEKVLATAVLLQLLTRYAFQSHYSWAGLYGDYVGIMPIYDRN